MKVAAGIAILVVLVLGLLLLIGPRDGGGSVPAGAEAGSAPATVTEPAPELPEVPGGRDEAREVVATEEPESTGETASENGAETATLVVHVVVDERDRPAPGVRVYAMHEEVRSLRNVEGARGALGEVPLTDESGTATLEVPPNRALTVQVLPDDETLSTESRELDALAPGAEHDVTIRLTRGNDATLYGRVVAAESGLPIAGAELHVERSRGMSIGGRAVRPLLLSDEPDLVTDAEGEFELEIASWRYELGTFTAEGRGPALAELTELYDSPENRLVVYLPRAAHLTGRVLGTSGEASVRLVTDTFQLGQPDGAFVHGLDRRWEGTIEPGGGFLVEDLPPAVSLRASVISHGRTLLREPAPLFLEAGETREVEWLVGAGATISGVAREADDRPAADLEIWLLPGDEAYGVYLASYYDPTKRTTTDAEGRFTFEDVAAGTWAVGPAPEKVRYDERPGPEALAAAVTRVTIEPGTTKAEVELRIWRGQFIEGRVLDPEGEGAARSGVSASGLEGGGSSHEQTGEDGSFRLGPLVPGRYRLRAESFGSGIHAPSEYVEARTGDTEIVLRMTVGGCLSGLVIDAHTGDPVEADVSITGVGDTDFTWMGTSGLREGVFSFEGLPPGTYHLVGASHDGRIGALRDVPVTPGATIDDLRIPIERGGSVCLSYEGPARHATFWIEMEGVKYAYTSLASGTEERAPVPAGELTVYLHGYGRSTSSASPPKLFERERTIRVEPGEEVQVVFEIDE